ELDRAWILVRRDDFLHVLLERAHHGCVARLAFFHHDERLDDGAALVVRPADHAAFGDRRMREQRRLDFRPGDVVARRDDHVVGARLVEEVAVLVHQIRIAGHVPAVLYIVLLPLIGEIAAAGGSFYREAPHHAGLAGLAILI